jgi:antitoxin VapB
MRALLEAHQLDALLLQRVSSFAWATCGGASYINTADSHGIASLLITPTDHYLITNNIEAERLEQEEELGEQNWLLCITPWHKAQNAVAELTQGRKLGADGPYAGAVDLSQDMSRLRAALTPAEGERYRTLGALCAKAMDAAIRAVHPGQSEYRIAAQLAEAAESRGVQVTVNLIATDERIFKFRHPLPTGKELDRYAMLVLCGRRYGLVCSVTRLVHFGPLPDELRRKVDAVAQIDAALISATRAGRSLGEIFTHATDVYARTGFPDEWTLHHQGGLAGYEPREVVATPETKDLVALGQAFAWNPSITGTKSEDTILVGEDNNEILTAIAGWPMLSIEVDGHTIERPAILEVT